MPEAAMIFKTLATLLFIDVSTSRVTRAIKAQYSLLLDRVGGIFGHITRFQGDVYLLLEIVMSDLRALELAYESFCAENLSLDMTRGKPSSSQLDLSDEMLNLPGKGKFKDADGVDCRNYGGVEGLSAMRGIFAEVMDVAAADVLVGGNSSLQLMYDTICRHLLFASPGASSPWGVGKVKFLCPVPGYDRHFSICEIFGIEMIPVPMNGEGPQMEVVERLVAEDAAIKGIWCVPKYSNPSGVTYTDDVVRALAIMKCAAPDFRIFWDNAYAVHMLDGAPASLLSIKSACEAAGNSERWIQFSSTSKITLAGGGVSALAASQANLKFLLKSINMQTIGPDKVNQLRHIQFFGDYSGVLAHMKKHAEILKPKFQIVDCVLNRELAGSELACWSKPEGGYFISLDTKPGMARAVVKLASDAGVKLTPAGATFPYGKDPQDSNIRIAPSMPVAKDLEKATEVLACCIKLAAARVRE
ncbi:MAG: aminotransferase class I/II-fold pyridoxal phosphate-dependent enzyme [bacterium]|nr:aminotransferase class I/II-fold pyridoxal phosphate-dependent enzyme [bacterium]